jgi:hypothetical protein
LRIAAFLFPSAFAPATTCFSVPNSGERAQDSQPPKLLAEGLDVVGVADIARRAHGTTHGRAVTPHGDFRVGRPELLTGRPWLDGPLHTRANLTARLYVTGVR